jgi:alginate O-acetyltransferase complex protein AlgI
MDFTSYKFILLFLPTAYLGFVLASRFAGWNMAVNWLALVSLAFYAMFGWKLFAVLLLSVFGNYVIASRINACGQGVIRDHARAKQLLTIGIAANLVLLCVLKYSNFFIDIINVAGLGFGHFNLLASIGLSFYTFVQIGYLIDAYNNQLVCHSLARYIVFSTFFPCVTAGPLVLQKEMMQQLESPKYPAFEPRRVIAGITMFGMGVFKKVVLADSIAPYADSIFTAASLGTTLNFDLAWIGSLCYALQLYFDFSGYSDMALGIGAIFGLKLPLNFDSPFKSTNISDFWRRWHMTMTRFFTNYIYTGLAMNGMRKAMTTQASPVKKFILTSAIPPVATFLVAGAWHGAGWTFLVYGLVHGIAIATFMAWSQFANFKLPRAIAWALTMSVVVSCLVIFRAPDLATAGHILKAMWTFKHLAADAIIPGFDFGRASAMVTILGAITVLMPNSQQILHLEWPTSDVKPENMAREAGFLEWRPGLANALVTGVGYTLALCLIGSGTGFLYYQF